MNLHIEVHIAFAEFILLSKQNSEMNLSQIAVALYHSSCRPADLLLNQSDTTLDLSWENQK